MTSSAMSRPLEIRLGAAGDALDRFEAAWHRVTEGRAMRPLNVLSFDNLPLMLSALSPARWALLQKLSEEGPLSIYELAKRLGRDYKNVHTDVTQLAAIRLIERQADGRVTVPWELLRAELKL
jgi:predicted transcriptional regulator